MNKIKTVIEQMALEALCDDAIVELYSAVEYYPEWPDVLYPADSLAEVEAQLNRARFNNESKDGCTGYSIFGEEYMEFLEAALIGNRELARRELVQTIAMLLRIGCHLDDYVKKVETGNSKLETGEVGNG